MIRFIDLKDQIIEGTNEFCFYDTVTDTFVTFSGSQTWETVEDFQNDYTGTEIERFLNLVPETFQFKKQENTTTSDKLAVFLKTCDSKDGLLLVDIRELNKHFHVKFITEIKSKAPFFSLGAFQIDDLALTSAHTTWIGDTGYTLQYHDDDILYLLPLCHKLK